LSKFNVDFAKEIEKLTHGGTVDIIDAICHYCADHNIDIETAASLIKKDAVLKSKIQIEAENLNILSRSARLPI
jgi:hypothetical protein